MTYHVNHAAVRKTTWFMLTLLVLLIASVSPVTAADTTPDDLDAWSEWVVDDIKDYGCPIVYNADTKYCSYPSSLKREWTGDQLYRTRQAAIADVREYVAVYYNSKRLHSTLGYKTPMNYEKDLNKVSGIS